MSFLLASGAHSPVASKGASVQRSKALRNSSAEGTEVAAAVAARCTRAAYHASRTHVLPDTSRWDGNVLGTCG